MKLKDIRKSIDEECISYSEILYLQDNKNEVMEYGDPVLAEWAGITESEFYGK